MSLKSHCLLFLIILLLYAKEIIGIPLSVIDGVDSVLVKTVSWGSTVILKCKSNDRAHNFQYWHLVDKGIIIGPANKYDLAKFRYEILSGNLTVKAVSKQEEGLYECVSRGIRDEDMNIEVVRIVVQSNFEDIYESDSNITIIKILIALIALILFSIAGWFVYRLWKDHNRYQNVVNVNDDDDDDESTEELFSQPSTSSSYKKRINNIVIPKKSREMESMPKQEVFDDVDISTDFKSILENSSDK